MSATKVVLALAAFGIAAVNAQCSASTITIAAPAEATIDCRTVEGSIVFEDNDALTGDIEISGPESIKGDLIINGTKNIVSLSSSTIGNIGGKFQLQSLERCSSIDFTALQTVGSIEWVTLPALESLNFGTEGVTQVDSVDIRDTHLSSLTGLSMVSVGSFRIANNDRLSEWTTQLTNISEELSVAQNSDNLEISFPQLIWAKYIEVRGIKSLDVPALQAVNTSIRFDENNLMESFTAPNLTRTGGDVAFAKNDALTNISFPSLTRSGSITISGNDKLTTIDGFPELERVDGSIRVLGTFDEAEFPKLDDVIGAFKMVSTEDIENTVCPKFDRLANPSGGETKVIAGKYDCGQDDNANEQDPNSEDGGNGDEGGSSVVSASVSLVLVAALAVVML